jgi:hypothetical protein
VVRFEWVMPSFWRRPEPSACNHAKHAESLAGAKGEDRLVGPTAD